MNRIFESNYEPVCTPLLPAEIADLLHGYNFSRLIRNYPVTTHIYRAIRTGYPTLFLKAGKYLKCEKRRLSWLDGKLLVPGVVAYCSFNNQEFLLLTEVPGIPADDKKLMVKITNLIEFLAEQVHVIHSLPTSGCPFDTRLEKLMVTAETIFRHQLLNPRLLSQMYRHRSINDLYQDLLQLYSDNGLQVFTHGDLCLPNILIQLGVSTGFIDWGDAGVGDPHRDLALLARSIRSNFGERYVNLFFDVYSHEVDKQKIEFYTLLDQFTIARCKQDARIVLQ